MNNDLISRSALIKALNEAQIEFDEYYKGLGKAKVITDNAPTIEITKLEHKAYNEGFKDGVDQGIKLSEKPQGNWEEPFEKNGKTYHKCNHCHISSELILIDNFCPNCGADMRKGGADMRGEKNDTKKD